MMATVWEDKKHKTSRFRARAKVQMLGPTVLSQFTFNELLIPSFQLYNKPWYTRFPRIIQLLRLENTPKIRELNH